MTTRSVLSKLFPETLAGGFSRRSGTVEFYNRVHSLIRPGMVILDYGAGRGLASESGLPFISNLTNFKSPAVHVIGVDIDNAITQNPLLDEAYLMEDGRIPLADQSVDIVFSDHVFEHVDDPDVATSEIGRVLRAGGWVCARTPATTSLIALGARLVPNRLHAQFIRRLQPDGPRRDADVFPTRYRMNSIRQLKRLFPETQWLHCSYYWDGDPTYHMGSLALARTLKFVMALKPGGEKLMIFLQKL